MPNKYEKAVMEWIDKHFEISAITIEDFPLFPYGKKIKDKNNQEMVVYYDCLISGKVKYEFPNN